jgi:hypothetical protein
MKIEDFTETQGLEEKFDPNDAEAYYYRALDYSSLKKFD